MKYLASLSCASILASGLVYGDESQMPKTPPDVSSTGGSAESVKQQDINQGQNSNPAGTEIPNHQSATTHDSGNQQTFDQSGGAETANTQNSGNQQTVDQSGGGAETANTQNSGNQQTVDQSGGGAETANTQNSGNQQTVDQSGGAETANTQNSGNQQTVDQSGGAETANTQNSGNQQTVDQSGGAETANTQNSGNQQTVDQSGGAETANTQNSGNQQTVDQSGGAETANTQNSGNQQTVDQSGGAETANTQNSGNQQTVDQSGGAETANTQNSGNQQTVDQSGGAETANTQNSGNQQTVDQSGGAETANTQNSGNQQTVDQSGGAETANTQNSGNQQTVDQSGGAETANTQNSGNQQTVDQSGGAETANTQNSGNQQTVDQSGGAETANTQNSGNQQTVDQTGGAEAANAGTQAASGSSAVATYYVKIREHHNANRASSLASEAVRPNNVGLTDEYNLEYFGTFKVGENEEAFTAVLDTGSSNIWVPGNSCWSDACWPKNRFSPYSSNTFETRGQPLSIQYGSGSMQGYVGYDSVSLGGLTIKNQGFAVAEELSSNFQYSPFDGIFGLAYRSIASDGVVPWMDSAVQQGLLPRAQFSFYLSNTPGDGTGRLIIGKPDPRYYQGDIEWHPLQPLSSGGLADRYYNIRFENISINGVNVGLTCQEQSACRAIVDSGTSMIVGPVQDIQNIKNQLNIAPDCSNYQEQPPIAFNIGGTSYLVPPEFYIVKTNTNGMEQCRDGFAPSETDFWIFGDAFMRAFYVVFDKTGSRVGFASLASDLSKPKELRTLHLH